MRKEKKRTKGRKPKEVTPGNVSIYGHNYPLWRTEKHPRYSTILRSESNAISTELMSGDTQLRLQFLLDTRTAHKRLYQQLTPPGFEIYAGTYRGTPGTPLFGRDVRSAFTNKPFVDAVDVDDCMKAFGACVESDFKRLPSLPPKDQVRVISAFFCRFGETHPYLDGNGHIQRLIVAACVYECPDLLLDPAWTIHERPYDEPMRKALEESPEKFKVDAVSLYLSDYIREVERDTSLEVGFI
jgi:fido (protein-threonine AMPylation protein)